jgi:polysaccharide biosynthesis/export protein
LLFPAALPAEDIGGHANRLAPGDRITVTVFGQPQLSGDVPIDGAGAIAIPRRIPWRSRTQRSWNARNASATADRTLQKPSVSVHIAELRPLYLLGDMRLPGVFGPGELLRNTPVSDFLLAEEHLMPRVPPHDEAAAGVSISQSYKTERDQSRGNDQCGFPVAAVAADMCFDGRP